MGRIPCSRLKRGPWTPEEDLCLTNYIQAHGEGRWRSLSNKTGLLRSGKSCRLRWMNYLRPEVKRGHILPDEEDLILRLHRLLGNRWSLIAGRLPGRTDNDVKNYWNSHLSKRLISQGIDPRTHRPLSESEDIWWIPQEGDMQEKIIRYTTTHESDNDSDCLISGHKRNQICSSITAPEIDYKDSDCLISSHEKDQICSPMAAPEISCSQSAPTILPSNGEEIPCIEMRKSNHFDNLKQITDGSCFPYSLPPTPTGPAYGNGSSYMYPSFLESFIDEEIELPEPSVGYNSVSHQSEFVSLGYELWSALHSPTTHYHRSH